MAKSEVKKRNSSNTIRPQTSPHDVLEDILGIELSNLSNSYKARKESTDKKTGLAQDIMSVSLTVLGGAITLKIFANAEIIKTPVLFILATAGLLVCVVISLVLRLLITSLWVKTTDSLSDHEEKLRLVVGDMKYHDDEHHTQAIENFDEITGNSIPLPPESRLTSLKAIVFLVSLFAISLVSIAISLLFKITVS